MSHELLLASLELLAATVREPDQLDVLTERKDIGQFRSRINGMIAALWRDEIDQNEFVIGMSGVLRKFLTESWLAGSKRCGIGAGEISQQEQAALDSFVNTNISFTPGFAGSIIEGNRASGAQLKSHQARAAMWVNAYPDARNQAQTIACGDQKLRWIWNPFKEHCSDCTALNGQVRRASFWAASGIHPQSRALECRGFNCGCRFAVSELPMSRGRLPGRF